MGKCDSLASNFENLPLENNQLKFFKETIIIKRGLSFVKGVVSTGSEKGNYTFELKVSERFDDKEKKRQMEEIAEKLKNAADTFVE